MQNLEQSIPIQVQSKLFNVPITLQAYQAEENGQYIITHNSLKSYFLEGMAARSAQNKTPIDVTYQPIETALSHCIVSCTIAMGGYKVTETGESCVATLNSQIAKNYPYIEAEMRAFDRAAISFLQLQINGKRVYSDEELSLPR